VDDDEDLLVKSAIAVRRKFAVQWLLVTRGPQGMCLIGPDDTPAFVRATAREVYDVSGAGDTVIATLAVGVANGLPFLASSILANAAAGIVVGKLGSQAVTYEELEATLRLDGSETRIAGASKITTLDAARMRLRAWQATGERIVFTSGRFDQLHPGTISLLRQAKALGGKVVVGISSEAAHADLPSPSPQDRAYVLSALECVDLIVIPGEPAPAIRALKPDVVVFVAGMDPAEVLGEELAEAYRGRIQLLPVLAGAPSRAPGAPVLI
jgi:D-beta-D-heptose 7-phosphate kinase/D-beta-D-heptose 1-phosphate adenosyltransferase